MASVCVYCYLLGPGTVPAALEVLTAPRELTGLLCSGVGVGGGALNLRSGVRLHSRIEEEKQGE